MNTMGIASLNAIRSRFGREDDFIDDRPSSAKKSNRFGRNDDDNEDGGRGRTSAPKKSNRSWRDDSSDEERDGSDRNRRRNGHDSHRGDVPRRKGRSRDVEDDDSEDHDVARHSSPGKKRGYEDHVVSLGHT
jgi:hypothetical protein